ncbi:MAG: GtrA family protein [Phycisphaerae bacterium]|nr:GtrA family protein [Phycisphaerae bacterium]
MKAGPASWLRRLWQYAFPRFLVVGILNTAFGYGVYAAGILLGLPRPPALLIATVLGVLFNFRTTGWIVFGSRDNRLLARFILVYAAMYMFNLGLLELLCRRIGFGSLVGQALSLPIVVVLTFLALKTLVFRAPKPPARCRCHTKE